MKLWESLKAIDEGSKSEFVNGSTKINGRDGYIDIHTSFALFPKDGWEEVKPPRQWSEKELMLFKLLPDWAKWIARDIHGYYACETKPHKNNNTFCSGGKAININYFDFLTITFEESPVYIGDLKGE